MKIIISLFILFSLIFAQKVPTGQLDKKLKSVEGKFKGVVLVANNDSILYYKSVGSEINKNSLFRIGSISKTFTAVIVLQLISEGKLSYNTKLSEFFPEIKNSNKITIKHLLSHRSGLYDITALPQYSEIRQKKQPYKKILKLIKETNPVFDPGSFMQYSNTNYILLSYIIEKIEEKSYSEILEKRISNRCGLMMTKYAPVSRIEEELNSYLYDSGEWIKVAPTHLSIPVGAGGIVSTPIDLWKFFKCLFVGNLLLPNYLEAMLTFADENYSLGLVKFKVFSTTGYGHNGVIDGFISLALYFPEEKLYFIFLSNGLGDKRLPLDLLEIILKK